MLSRLVTLLLLGLVLLTFSDRSAHAKSRALLVGVGAYENLPADLFLSGPENDVALIADLLTSKMGYDEQDIKRLLDEEATYEAIVSTIRTWLIEETTAGDQVYFYFSGHGVQVRDQNGDEKDNKDEALAPYDLEVGENDFSNVLADDEIETLLAQLQGRAVTVIVDACHSGTITRSLSPAKPPKGARFLLHDRQLQRPLAPASRAITFEPKQLDKPDGIIALSAAAPHQLAFDDLRKPEDDRTGVFTGAYVAGVLSQKADSNGNGMVSFAELLAHLRKESDIYCSQSADCQDLTPTMEIPEAAQKYSVLPTFTTAKPDRPASELELNAPVTTFTADTISSLKKHHAKPEGSYETASEMLVQPGAPTLHAHLRPGRHLKEGQSFTIHVTSDHDGDLLLYDLDKDGNALQLFPNDVSHKATRLTAGRPFFMPDDDYGFDFEAARPGGSILAILVKDPILLEAFAPKYLGLTTSLDAETLLNTIGKHLSDYFVDRSHAIPTVRHVEWSYQLIPYTVE